MPVSRCRKRRGASDSRLPSPIPARVYRTLDEEVKRQYHPIPPRYERLPAFCLFLYAVAAVCLILLIIQSGSVAFSDWFNLHISAPLRAFLVVTLRHAIRRRCDSWRTAGVFIGVLISVLLSFFSVFVLNFSAGYRNSTLDVKLELEQKQVSAEDLADTARILVRHLNEEAGKLGFERDGFSVMPYSLAEMNDRLSDAYDDEWHGAGLRPAPRATGVL